MLEYDDVIRVDLMWEAGFSFIAERIILIFGIALVKESADEDVGGNKIITRYDEGRDGYYYVGSVLY